LPQDFTNRIKQQFADSALDFFASLNRDSSLSIRINREKIGDIELNLPKVPWCETGYYLNQRPNFTIDPWFQAGAYYVQEPSSMFLWHIFSVLFSENTPETVLDLCAAPGGKSTLLASFFPQETFIMANEVVQSRAGILTENIDKWGADNVVVTNSDPRIFSRLPNFFDVCLVDAPCSGEGLFRKDPASVEQWSVDNANLCAQRQKRILMDVWDSIKPGGIVLYSTCTFNPAENEENMAWLATQHDAECVEIPTKPEWGIECIEFQGIKGYRFAYHRVQGEGFFVAVVRKLSGSGSELKSKKQGLGNPIPKNLKPKLESWVTRGHQFLLNDSIFNVTFNPRYLSAVLGNVNIVRAGCKIATVIRDDMKPTHFLALSNSLNVNAFRKIELDNEQVNLFLRRENFRLGEPETGLYLATWKAMPVGFVNHLGNRVNTSLPQEYRILKPFPFHGESLENLWG
jgi:16S rRNA C967 or C1407 C5-methylase (RsmB/RsmF family)/NOL1/NOP2/fmu family ribosome biogenesis protein